MHVAMGMMHVAMVMTHVAMAMMHVAMELDEGERITAQVVQATRIAKGSPTTGLGLCPIHSK
jgi:hypothetical protein